MSTRSRTLIALVAGSVFGFSAALTGDVLAQRPARDPAPVERAVAPAGLPQDEARLLAEVFQRIKREYVEEVDDRTLIERAVRGMVTSLDPHSTFLDSSQFAEMRLSTAGSYPGVGIEVAAEGGYVTVLRPIEGSPAELSGMQAGDRIVRIDDAEVGEDLSGAIARLRGPAGSAVKLTVLRDGAAEPLDFTVRRAKVAVKSVAQQTIEPGYGYLRITTFNDSTPADLERAVARLKRDNPDGLKGVVLDLRNNPGGVLESGVAVADAFLGEGVIVTADGRTAEARFRMDATPGDLLEGVPLVVLVNGGSASCSEIVAGALKDHGRAALVGHKTYGKGSVQTIMPLSRGGAIKITTSRYYTPSGASIQGTGILPDVVPEGPERPPLVRTSNGTATAAERDSEVLVAMDLLKSGTPVVARALKAAMP
jgi:carboxyl-terminal processing protease